MFDRLDFSPMVVVLLLLYGLLIAVCLVLWTALDLGGRRRQPARDAAATAGAPVVKAEPARQVAPSKEFTPTPVPVSTPRRRAADSESVVSYSVRPRVSAPEAPAKPVTEPAARPAKETAAREIPADAPRTTAREPLAPASTPPVRPPQDFPVGRSSRVAQAAKSTPAAPPAGQPSGRQESGKNEDAFERFLRSSRTDSDDY